MSIFRFTPDVRHVYSMDGSASVEEIAAEPMLFSADLVFALKNGGPLTKKALYALCECGVPQSNLIIDTKSVMLMPGMYPAIPGWHCDNVLRRSNNGQPDLESLNSNIYNYSVSLSSSQTGGVSRTEFLLNDAELEINENRVWQSVDSAVNDNFPNNILSVPDGNVMRFSQPTIHRATPATEKGWRFFFRASEPNGKKPLNEIRKQVQVYTDINNGW